MILAGTGHRPPKLGLGYDDASRDRLFSFVRGRLSAIPEVTEVVSGMAQGFDQALAEAALSLGLPLVAAVAFRGMEDRWPEDARERYYGILSRAAWVHEVSGPGYAGKKFILRDRWMVEHADALVALYDETERKSGTGATVAWARAKGKPVVNTWGEWVSR